MDLTRRTSCTPVQIGCWDCSTWNQLVLGLIYIVSSHSIWWEGTLLSGFLGFPKYFTETSLSWIWQLSRFQWCFFTLLAHSSKFNRTSVRHAKSLFPAVPTKFFILFERKIMEKEKFRTSDKGAERSHLSPTKPRHGIFKLDFSRVSFLEKVIVSKIKSR